MGALSTPRRMGPQSSLAQSAGSPSSQLLLSGHQMRVPSWQSTASPATGVRGCGAGGSIPGVASTGARSSCSSTQLTAAPPSATTRGAESGFEGLRRSSPSTGRAPSGRCPECAQSQTSTGLACPRVATGVEYTNTWAVATNVHEAWRLRRSTARRRGSRPSAGWDTSSACSPASTRMLLWPSSKVLLRTPVPRAFMWLAKTAAPGSPTSEAMPNTTRMSHLTSTCSRCPTLRRSARDKGSASPTP
mmetsp:Transcript_35188/g.100515  ORF Transcript_35188/g.100515 Transcript_35188/m.100515 type:complete len:246 (+) Transcript_35188:864-1601(+)